MTDPSANPDVPLVPPARSIGDCVAGEELLPLVYDELRRIAAARMVQQTAGQTLQATALVHEAWQRLGDGRFESRAHFFPPPRRPCGICSSNAPGANSARATAAAWSA